MALVVADAGSGEGGDGGGGARGGMLLIYRR